MLALPSRSGRLYDKPGAFRYELLKSEDIWHANVMRFGIEAVDYYRAKKTS